MKKYFYSCTNCGYDASILTLVSSAPEVVMLYGDCYNLQCSKEEQNVISHDKKENRKVKNNKKIDNFYGLGKFNYLIFKFLCSRFRL